ncbi:TolC family protein [Methylobacter sp.]|uniref:TolC family protein n=1 Tax=Methylobacter sp. TaxID=2051955 RepID=UPI003DA26CDD
MFALNLIRGCLPVYLLATSLVFADALPAVTVEHRDPIEIDAGMSLAQTIDLTLEKHPDNAWLKALEEESAALEQRSKSWFAGAPSVGLFFQEATSGTLHYGDANVRAPLWNFGQRDAEKAVARQAEISAHTQSAAIKLRVAGLVRMALWDMELQQIRLDQAHNEVHIFEQLLTKVERRVELGDLPRADLLLAQTELLQKRAVLTQAEAEVMHARKRYTTITQMIKVPGNYRETLADIAEVQQNHPDLVAINDLIARMQAEVEAIRAVGSGQPDVAVGINTDHGPDERSNKTESFNISVSVPFGGQAHLAPRVAAANVELNRLVADREQLRRDLDQAHHEAEHNLEVNRAELTIAENLKQAAVEHLKMTELSFSLGEINLLDLLKIQSRAQQAILNAKERSVILERDKAMYNQSVGVTP